MAGGKAVEHCASAAAQDRAGGSTDGGEAGYQQLCWLPGSCMGS